jgi:hypothetical protein
MNALNRVLIVAQMLLLVLSGSLLLLYVVGFVPLSSVPFGPYIADWLGAISVADPTMKLQVSLGIIALVGGAIFLLVLELTPRAHFERILITRGRGRAMSIDRASVQRLVEQAVREVPHVKHFKAAVRPGRKGVRLKCRAQVLAGVNLVELGDDLEARISARVKEGTGLAVAHCDLKIKLVPRPMVEDPDEPDVVLAKPAPAPKSASKKPAPAPSKPVPAPPKPVPAPPKPVPAPPKPVPAPPKPVPAPPTPAAKPEAPAAGFDKRRLTPPTERVERAHKEVDDADASPAPAGDGGETTR